MHLSTQAVSTIAVALLASGLGPLFFSVLASVSWSQHYLVGMEGFGHLFASHYFDVNRLLGFQCG